MTITGGPNLLTLSHRRDAEDAENSKGKDRGTATAFAVVTQSSLCDLCVSAVKNIIAA
jgi:hypothetical protein